VPAEKGWAAGVLSDFTEELVKLTKKFIKLNKQNIFSEIVSQNAKNPRGVCIEPSISKVSNIRANILPPFFKLLLKHALLSYFLSV